MLEAERERVAAAGGRLAEAGLVQGTAGNISARAGELIAVTSTGSRLSDLGPDDVSVVDGVGAVVGGAPRPTSELALHLEIYRRYDAGAVVHTHAPVATALSCVLDELPCMHYQLLTLGGAVRVAPYATFGTKQLAEVVVEALRDRCAALMANHGAVTLGPDLDAAVERMLLLEWACQLYAQAASLSAPRSLNAEQRRAALRALDERGPGTMPPSGEPS